MSTLGTHAYFESCTPLVKWRNSNSDSNFIKGWIKIASLFYILENSPLAYRAGHAMFSGIRPNIWQGNVATPLRGGGEICNELLLQIS